MKKLFKIQSSYQPVGEPLQAIMKLREGLNDAEVHQTLLGVTSSGKTFTITQFY